jgi:hypothetical protein
VERAAKLLIHLQKAQSLGGELRFNEAIRNENKVWQYIKENGKKDETKRTSRNILAEDYLKEEQYEERDFFNAGNLATNAYDMKTIILGLRMALHLKDFDYLRKHSGISEDMLINLVKCNEGNEFFYTSEDN